MNGNTFAGGRPVSGLYGGRAVSPVLSSWAGDGGAWPGNATACGARPRCCCKGPWTIGPGETLPLVLQWQRWIDSVPGYALSKVVETSLFDMTVNPPVAADPEIIKIVSGTDDSTEEPDNEDAADLIGLIPPYATQALVAVGDAARIGAQFRLNIAVTARDCDGRRITMRDCVAIVIAEC